jgi:hypothetical protein
MRIVAEILILFLATSIICGCTSRGIFYQQTEKKQVFQKRSERNYLLCNSCLNPTKINFNQSPEEEPCLITK